VPVDDLVAAFSAWRERALGRLRDLMGGDPSLVPLDVEVMSATDAGAYRREHVVFDTEAAMSVPAYLLVPHERTTPGPAVLAVHGHGPGKDAVCGLDGETEQYAHDLASRGYVVLAPDLRGFGERADWMPPDKYGCDWNLVCATLAGAHPLTQNVWDLMRCVDVLAAHPLIDPQRIAAVGFSYGATTTLFLAALDERVRAAVLSGYLSSWQAAHAVPWNMCGSQVLPGLLDAFEHVDIAALVAPRPILVESGRADPIFPIAAATETVHALERLYAHLGAPRALAHHVFDGAHEWHGGTVPAFLARTL
jgi:dienelactone hydrolase